MEQQYAYDYLNSLVLRARPLINKIADEWETLTLGQVETIAAELREYSEEAQSIYEELDGDNLGIIDLVHQLELAQQEAEDLFNEKEAKE
jgi:hypothetical protein